MEFSPDSPVVDEVVPSPNRGARRADRRPDMLVLHYTQMASAAAALRRLCEPDAEVSAHYLVDEDGRITQLVPERERAWHAGLGGWGGDTDINSCSIGVEIANGGHAAGLPPYPAPQIEAVIRLCADIVGRWAIPPRRVLAHSDVAPDRKEDPGELFPWRRLGEAGIGLWVPPAPIGTDRGMAPGANGPEVGALQGRLATYGYALATTGLYDEATVSVVSAFQRHFRPERVDGIADRSTRDTLAALAEAAARPDGTADRDPR